MYKAIHNIASRSRKGFTLIEMLIVIAIIGILASIVLVGLGPIQRRGRDARRQTDLRNIQNALELYYNKCNHYPGGPNCEAPSGGTMSWGTLTETLIGASIGTNQIPNDPAAGSDPSSPRSYRYATDSSGTTYVLAATLEDPDNPALQQSLKTPPAGINVDCSGANYCISL